MDRRTLLQSLASGAASAPLAAALAASANRGSAGDPRFRQRYVDTDSGQLYCWTAGEGPCLVLVHQSGNSSEEFAALVPLLGDRYRLVAVDLPGHGRSDLKWDRQKPQRAKPPRDTSKHPQMGQAKHPLKGDRQKTSKGTGTAKGSKGTAQMDILRHPQRGQAQSAGTKRSRRSACQCCSFRARRTVTSAVRRHCYPSFRAARGASCPVAVRSCSMTNRALVQR